MMKGCTLGWALIKKGHMHSNTCLIGKSTGKRKETSPPQKEKIAARLLSHMFLGVTKSVGGYPSWYLIAQSALCVCVCMCMCVCVCVSET